MNWTLAHRFHPGAVALADRHYSRRYPGTPQFVPPGRNIVLLSRDRCALWVSLEQQYVKHAWPKSWQCCLFRNEGSTLSSTLITEAVAATLNRWRHTPEQGFITFVNPDKIRPKRDPGRCYLKAGWSVIGKTDGGLVVLQLLPENFPFAEPPYSPQLEFNVRLFQPATA